MIKLIKIIIINLQKIFDINKINVLKENKIKSNLESKLVIISVMTMLCGYGLYNILINISSSFSNNYIILDLGFIISTIFCFIMNLMLIEPVIFKNNDSELLFSLPLTKNEIILSKVFDIYIKNILFVIVIMFSSLMAFHNLGMTITDTLVLSYIICSLMIPFVPIIISSLIIYVINNLKVKLGHNLSKILYILGYLLLGLVLFILGNNINDIEFSNVIKNIFIYYPLVSLFNNVVMNVDLLSLFLSILIPICFMYIYIITLSDNYIKICSKLKGVNKKNKFIYKEKINLRKNFGLLRKEFSNLFNNKLYFNGTVKTYLILSLLLVIGISFINVSEVTATKNFWPYFNLYVPSLLSLLVSLNVTSVNVLSLEKDNIQMLATMPIKFSKVLFMKWLFSVLVGIGFIIINATVIILAFKADLFTKIMCYIFPLMTLMFLSLVGLVLDYRFFDKKEMNEAKIIKQRFIVLIPTLIAIIIAFGPLFLPIYTNYKPVLLSYIFMMLIVGFILLIYLFINRKKMYRSLFN